MPIFLDTRGRSTLGIGICGRCSEKMSLDELYDDPNSPGLKVCRQDLDELDPYLLPPRESDRLDLPFCRPDVSLTDLGVTPLFGPNQLNPIVNGVPLLHEPLSFLRAARAWQPNAWYEKGDTITPENVDSDTTNLPQVWLVCLESGWSGTTPPIWPAQTGVPFREGDSITLGDEGSYFGTYFGAHFAGYFGTTSR